MGTSTDGILCYGVVYGEVDFPWDAEPWDGDEEDWWVGAGMPPFHVVNYCSSECPLWILAIPGTVQTASRGFPETVLPLEVNADALERFEAFVATLDVKPDEENEAQWLLCSYWGW